MIFQRAVYSDVPDLVADLRWFFVDLVARRCRDSRLVFSGLLLWDVVEIPRPERPIGFEHRIEVELVEAVGRKSSTRKTIARLMSKDEFLACARKVRSL